MMIYVQECIYIYLLYVQMEQLWICVHVWYWLLFAWCVIDWVYFIIDMHLYEYCVITDTFKSLFMS